jgi:proline racemase
VRAFTDAADALTQAAKSIPLTHPDSPDLAFLYGTIITDSGNGKDAPSKNICVFADREVDRSPTGSGVTARLAAMYAKGGIGIGETRLFESVTGARFTGEVVRTVKSGPHDAVIARVGGRAHYTGKAVFTVEEDDPLGGGFLLR